MWSASFFEDESAVTVAVEFTQEEEEFVNESIFFFLGRNDWNHNLELSYDCDDQAPNNETHDSSLEQLEQQQQQQEEEEEEEQISTSFFRTRRFINWNRKNKARIRAERGLLKKRNACSEFAERTSERIWRKGDEREETLERKGERREKRERAMVGEDV